MAQLSYEIHQVVIMINLVLFISKHDFVQVGKISVKINAIRVTSSNQVICASLEKYLCTR